MSATIQQEDGSTWQIRVSGVLKKVELDSAHAAARVTIAKGGKLRVLMVLDGFQGWEKGADWGDMTFMIAHGDNIERIAVAGDPKWKDEMMMFLGAGYRRTKVKFFPQAELAQARTWLQEAAR
jgi:hypothetical protein